MSEDRERCVQKRILNFSRNPSNWIFFLPMIALFFVVFIFLYSRIIGPEETIDVLLALVIAFFSGVQGYSTLSQVRLARERNRIEDLRNELETAYGPLYTILNRRKSPIGRETMILLRQDKRFLDDIVATYPHMFPAEIYDLWRKEIQPTIYIWHPSGI